MLGLTVRLDQKGPDQKTQRKAFLAFHQCCPLGCKELLGGEKIAMLYLLNHMQRGTL